MIKRKAVKITVSDTAPLYPPMWGGPKRVWGLYANFGEVFDITYVGVDTSSPKEYRNRKVKNNLREVIQPLSNIYYLFRRLELKVIKNLTFDLFTYILMCFDKGFVRELNKYDADILVSSHPWSSPCFKIKKHQIFIYDAHNCEYFLMKQILKGRWYSWITSFFIKLIEMRACQKAKIIIVTSEEDKESFIKLYKVREDKIFILPNGTYIEELPDENKKDRIRARLRRNNREILFFIGAYYNPNIEAARFIVGEIAAELKDVDIVILGTVSDYFRNNNVPENVRLIGRVNDEELFEWLAIADLALNPMFTGSGINMKMLDYFSFGLPAITTWVGARGIDGVDSTDFIACNKEEFLDTVKSLLKNKERRAKIGRNARRIAENTYDWRKISAEYSNTLKSLIEASQVDSGASQDPFFCHGKI